jgi:ArsR family transcriptional regulator
MNVNIPGRLPVVETGCVRRGPRPLGDEEVRDLTRIFRALADPTRLQMMAMLVRADAPLCACEVEEQFELSQPTISHHLKVLRQAGLVTGARSSHWIHYSPTETGRVWLDSLRGGALAP